MDPHQSQGRTPVWDTAPARTVWDRLDQDESAYTRLQDKHDEEERCDQLECRACSLLTYFLLLLNRGTVVTHPDI